MNDRRLVAETRSLGLVCISASFLPHFCLNPLQPTRKIQILVAFGTLWYRLVPWVAGNAGPARRFYVRAAARLVHPW